MKNMVAKINSSFNQFMFLKLQILFKEYFVGYEVYIKYFCCKFTCHIQF